MMPVLPDDGREATALWTLDNLRTLRRQVDRLYACLSDQGGTVDSSSPYEASSGSKGETLGGSDDTGPCGREESARS